MYRPESLPGATVMLCSSTVPWGGAFVFFPLLPNREYPSIDLSVLLHSARPGEHPSHHLLFWFGLVWPGLGLHLTQRPHTRPGCALRCRRGPSARRMRVHHSPSDALVPSHVSCGNIYVLCSVRLNDIMGMAKPQCRVLCDGAHNVPCWGIVVLLASRLWWMMLPWVICMGRNGAT